MKSGPIETNDYNPVGDAPAGPLDLPAGLHPVGDVMPTSGAGIPYVSSQNSQAQAPYKGNWEKSDAGMQPAVLQDDKENGRP